jgi:DNA (cytosine-5)-methyltransferase 1
MSNKGMKLKVGSDFSGVGAFNQSLIRLGINYEEVFACDMDKYARQTFIHNYGKPKYYPKNVYNRNIPKESLDIYMSSPPCQSFSLAGKRKGEKDDRGILFYNTHEFISKNKPRFFIIENVKGLLSDDGGKTFQRWIDYLAGKSVNGNSVMFPMEETTPYHVYYDVLNAKSYGIPQNRERVFIVGVRDDKDNHFRWPKPVPLTKRLKDVLESNVDEKYYLSDKMLELISYNGKKNGIIADLNKGGQKGSVFSENSESMSCLSATDYKQPKQIQVKSATKKGYEIATVNDSINLERPDSNTRRGRVGKCVAQTLDTGCNQGVIIGAFRGRNPENKSDRTTGAPMEQTLELNYKGTSNTITSVQKDNVVVMKNYIQWDSSGKGYNSQQDRAFYENGCMGTLAASNGGNKHNVLMNDYKIRRLTPRECFRLMDFPDTFTWPVSNSQAYKQAGNSICVGVLANIINNLNLL